ncbi:MAG: hypothetical protein JXR96_19760 [Deltaproteobacteria bacterium]|nr:hypothetical protein [Deltaproteobacteria bacterium]
MSTGVITDYDPADGLGWIRTDEGQDVRFSLTACGYTRPEVGLRVRILGLTEGFGGNPKATLIEPLEAQSEA